MVRCPKCGKVNQDSSRFCNKCGATLPQTRIRCPQCGTMNPIGNVFCNRCNARILPADMHLPEQPKPAEESSVGVKGISLPTLQTTKEGALEPEELPDWLLELTEQSSGKTTGAPRREEPAPLEQYPDWLSDLVDETTGGAGRETAGTLAADESGAEETSAFSELPDWLSTLPSDDPAPQAAEPEATIAEGMRDWFTDLFEDEPVETAPAAIEPEEAVLEELPDWLSEVMPEEPAPSPVAWETVLSDEPGPSSPVSATKPRAALPDWLLATAMPASDQKAPASQPLPEWLAKNAVAPGQETGGTSGTGQFPAWLLKGAETDTAPAAPRAPTPPQRPMPFEVEKPARPAAQVPPAPARPQKTEPEERAEPDWLADLYPEEPEPDTRPAPKTGKEPAPVATAPAGGLPDWLMDIYSEEETEPATAAGATEAADNELPDWIAGIYGEEEVEPQATVPATQPKDTATTQKAAEGVPDWLAGIYNEEKTEPAATAFVGEPEEDDITPETAVPDWLASIVTEKPIPPQPRKPAEDEAPEPPMDIPDWLAGLQTKTSPVEEKQPSPFAADVSIFTAKTPEKTQADSSATPDWLKGITTAPEERALEPARPAFLSAAASSDELAEENYEEPVLQSGEIPDWLKGLSPAATPGPVETEAAFIERAAEDESLVRAKVPSWLQGLRPPGTGPLPPLPEMMVPGAAAASEEGGLARADIPEWVQQLRPEPSAAGEAGEKRPLEPVETEGPLANLRGVLPDGAALDMPADYQSPPPPAIPDSVVAQAQLWQQLLEQPRSVQRPVAQHHTRSGKGQAAMRLIVAAVLLAVTILGLWGSALPLSQALSRPHIEQLSRAIDALQPGDTVIVAVEYGPAEAGEMGILARAVMQHLADRETEVILVSTLPEGAGLIQGLLAPLALANRLPARQTAYLPGSSTGVAQFLSEPAEAGMLIVLAGRAERLRWWIEQNNATQALPTVLAINAATAPVAAPYLEASPVTGWIAGLPDVAAYQQFRGLSSSILSSQLDALMLAHWAALALLLFGLFYYLALGKKGAS
jgi:hypothetical protein